MAFDADKLFLSDSPWEGVDAARNANEEHEKWWKKRQAAQSGLDEVQRARDAEQQRLDELSGTIQAPTLLPIGIGSQVSTPKSLAGRNKSTR